MTDIYEPVIAELKAQIEEWQKMIVGLELMRSKGIVHASGASAIPQQTRQDTSVSFSNDAFFGMTIADAAKKYLGTIKKTAKANTIADALLAGGLKTAAKVFVESVRSILSKHPNFVLINGEFGLSEWYPGRKVAPKKPVNGAQSETEETQELTPEEAFGANPIEFRRLA